MHPPPHPHAGPQPTVAVSPSSALLHSEVAVGVGGGHRPCLSLGTSGLGGGRGLSILLCLPMAYLGCVGPPNPGDKHCCHKHSPGDQRFQEEPQRCTPPCTPPQPPNPAGGGNPSRARPPPTLHPEPGKALFVGDHHCHPHQHSGRRATSASSPRVNRAAPPTSMFPHSQHSYGAGSGLRPPHRVLPPCA